MRSDSETTSHSSFIPVGSGGITLKGLVLGDGKGIFFKPWRLGNSSMMGEVFCMPSGSWLQPMAQISCYYKHLVKSPLYLINNLKISDVAK